MGPKLRDFYQDQLAKQRRWIEDHGGNLAGYLDLYNGKYGRTMENAREIFNADQEELSRLERVLR